MTDITEHLRALARDYHQHRPYYTKAADEIERLRGLLTRCETILGNMALENEGAIFNRWPISHEPLRSDARNLLPLIKQAAKP